MKGDQLEILTDRGNTFRVTEDNDGECRSCGEPIIWTVTARGKRMPVDVLTVPGEATTSHFATCPDHEQWRKS